MRPPLPLCLLLLLLGCGTATNRAAPLRNVAIQSTEPLLLESAAGRISIQVNADDTLVEIDDQIFICRGVRGYIGRFDVERGWMKIGKVEFGYEPDTIWIRGRRSWNTVLREGQQSYVVSQEGDIGRSILRR